ncbi:LMBR1 domain-containing protein 2 [Durusdinium trenchii]
MSAKWGCPMPADDNLKWQSREWCPQISGASSIGVSSICVSSTGGTGLSRSLFAANLSSRASSDSGSWHSRSISMADFQQRHYLEDLKSFAASFTLPIMLVKECVGQVDDDLLQTVLRLDAQAQGLVAFAEGIVQNFTTSCFKVLDSVASLSTANGIDMDLLKEVNHLIAELFNKTLGARTRYIELLSQVRYLGECTQLTLDQIIMAQLPEAEGEIGESPMPDDLKSEHCLDVALRQLQKVCCMMEDCPHFWLTLHGAELQLRKIHKEAQLLCSQPPRMDNLGGARLNAFCEKIQILCEEHCGMDEANLSSVEGSLVNEAASHEAGTELGSY